jgi:hypothetical protein
VLSRDELDIIKLGPFVFMGLSHQFYFVAVIGPDVFEEAP